MNIAMLSDFDVRLVRKDFPILQRKINGKPLVYLDNSGTTQKPAAVIKAMTDFYSHDNANIHRGIHTLSQSATTLYQQARETVRQFIHAADVSEIIFVRGTTEAVNLVAQSYGTQLQAGDEIIISAMEHHSNLVPWQMACEKSGAHLRILPVSADGEIDIGALAAMLNARTKMLAIAHISNVLGTINPVQEIIALAHAHKVPVLLDGAQAIAHKKVDMQQLDCDFYAFSGHKLYAPAGIGVLYGKRELLEMLPPYQTGGGMISRVTFAKTEYQPLPEKWEAGTPNIEGAIGLAAAIDYVQKIGLERISAHERLLLDYAEQALDAIAGLKIIGRAKHKAAVLSFVMEGIHPHDIGTVLDHEGVAIRAGHHCAMPLMEHLGLPATARASFALYNTRDEVDALVAAIQKTKQVFS